MKGPGILKSILVAVIASVATGFLNSIFPLIFSSFTSNSLIILSLSLGYLLFLLKHAEIKKGRIVVMVMWLALNLGGLLLGISLVEQILLQLLIIWVARSLYFHASIVAALLDLILIVMASGAAVWAAIQTDSLITAVWSFFLCQSLFGSIPDLSRKANPQGQAYTTQNDHFESAHRVAQEAVRKLSIN
jgi:hypothetical protein